MRHIEEIMERLAQLHAKCSREVQEILDEMTDEDLHRVIAMCNDEIHEFARFRLEVKHRAEAVLAGRGSLK